MRERSLGRTREFEGITLERKGAVSLIQEEQGAASTNYKKVLESLVLKIGKQSACATVEYTDSRLLRYVFKCAVAPIAVEAVWESSRLAHIEIVESVIVEIARRHTIVAVDV